jgi:hypothetical protein
MKNFYLKFTTFILFIVGVLYAQSASGWHDETHLAVAKASGYYKWYNAVGADIARVKAGSIESYNHFFSNPDNVEVTPELIIKQADHYNDPRDKDGHMYGAIVGSLRLYRSGVKAGKYSEYHMAFASHYIADMSNPLHNMPNDRFNQSRHQIYDGTVEKEILDNLDKLKQHMYPVHIRQDHFEEDLAKEIAKIANRARKFGFVLKKENRNMTKEEAYIQLGQSASLLKAVVDYPWKN